MDAVVIALFWVLALAAVAAGIRPTIYLFFCAAPFGSLAVVPTALTGGLTFTPMPIAALLLVLRACLLPGFAGFLARHLTHARPLLLIALFWCVAVVATLFLPRLFAGVVLVVPVRVIEGSLAPLGPSVQNISQLFYMTISVLTVIAAFALMRREDLRRTMLHAILAGALVHVATGFADLYADMLGIAGFLESFRTATYNLIVDAEVLGARRVVGLMPEASAFGSVCVRFLAYLFFLRHAFAADDASRVLIAPTMLALCVLVYLSTSSAAYVGLAMVVAVALVEWLYRSLAAREPRHRRQVAVDLGIAAIAVVGAIGVLILSPRLVSALWLALDEIIFSKAETTSFAERGLWTATALQATIDTFGLGVGVGGTRASNSLVALVSNVGVLGALLYFSFVLACYLQRPLDPNSQSAWVLMGCRWALFPGLAVGMLIGTSADFGPTAGFIYGTMLAIGLDRQRRTRPLPQRSTPGAIPYPA